MNQKRNQQPPRSITRNVFAAAAVCVTVALLAPTLTNAEFTDSTYASTTASVESMASAPPINNGQSAASALFIDKLGRLFVSGNRDWGDGVGNGSQNNPVAATAPPTHVEVGDARIVDAAGSSNDFQFGQATAYMALDADGQVWTWGIPYGYANNLGRGTGLTYPQAYTAGLVTIPPGPNGEASKIVDMERAENQFYALDEHGTMWTWGYENENLGRSYTGNDHQLPKAANTVVTAHGSGNCTNTSNTSTVTWHSIWGGNNGAAGVANNGLIYTWGYDNPGDVTNTGRSTQRCPILNEAANRALFAAYPEYYQDANGGTYSGDTSDLSSAARTARTAQYTAIVSEMQTKVLSVCASVSDKKTVDTSECPVRQFGYSARAPQLLLQNGDLYTWQISSADYGKPFLGRDSSTAASTNTNNWDQPGNIYYPTVVLQNVNYVSHGVSSMTALTQEGKVYGWGRNNLCQAIGEPSGGPTDCITAYTASNSINNIYLAVLPTPIANIPEDATITRLGASQCATWAEAADGRTWAWGAGTAVGYNYQQCYANPSRANGPFPEGGYKIFNTLEASGEFPFGKPVEAYATGTIRVR